MAKRVTTTREFDAEGRLVKEVVVEETTPDPRPNHWERPYGWPDRIGGTPSWPAQPLIVR